MDTAVFRELAQLVGPWVASVLILAWWGYTWRERRSQNPSDRDILIGIQAQLTSISSRLGDIWIHLQRGGK